tara:strand:- start:4806 stop:6068 length:1263 start_codon:yes stop_codon:yes gene_type:complete
MNIAKEIFILGRKYNATNNALDKLLKENVQAFEETINNINSSEFDSLICLSTCNRFEIIGKGEYSKIYTILKNKFPLFLELEAIFYFKKGNDAIAHIFKMPSGLDSNILGDVEILGQFKNACKAAKQQKKICSYMERLINTSLQSSKEIRDKTNITNGTTSLSYAAIEIIKNRNISINHSILLIGLGKFGKSIAKNIKEYFPENPLSIVNRTLEKSKVITQELNCQYFLFEDLATNIDQYDIIISAIDSNLKQNSALTNSISPKLIIDLSVPSFFDNTISEKKNIDYIDISEASVIINKALSNRTDSLPKANIIIEKYKKEFTDWVIINQKYLKHWRNKINSISHDCEQFESFQKIETEKILNKSIGEYVVYVKKNKDKKSKETLMLDFATKNMENNCLVNKYSHLKNPVNCNKCQVKYS